MKVSLHEFLIDDDGRGWCGDNCPADPESDEGPHWAGELPEERW